MEILVIFFSQDNKPLQISHPWADDRRSVQPSLTAFRMGYEWNLAMIAQAGLFTFHEAFEKFMHSFYHEFTYPLNEESELMLPQQGKPEAEVDPNR
jgi:hypothetical protein